MEPWHEVTFMVADGERALEAFAQHVGSKYERRGAARASW
jgi:hypothetical protein